MNLSVRTARLVLAGVLFSAAIGCNRSPTAPSSKIDTAMGTLPSPAAAGTATSSAMRFGKRTPGVVFVRSQGLYYDTFVVKDPLPMHGRFQLLENGETEFGPGQPGYLGGRWWEDLNNNGVQDAGDHFFLCPLLPPGRETP
jgi:hypothetical protein